MKVLYIVTAYDRHPGDGITPWLVETIRRLGRAGVEVEVLAPSYRGLASGKVDGVMVHRFRYAPAALETLTHDQTTPDRIRERPLYLGLVPTYLVSATLAARRLARSGTFDLVHVHWPLPHVLPGWAARAAAGIPLILTFHGVELTFARHAAAPVLVPFLRRAIRTADALTANSSYTAGMIRQLHDRPVEIIPFGSTVGEADPPDEPSAEPGAGPGAELAAGPAVRPGTTHPGETLPGAPDPIVPAARILFVGRLVERKGVHVLLQTMGELTPEREVHLDVVGEGPLRPELERRAAEQGVAGRVTFHGFVSSTELRRHFAACDVFVLPAVYDTKGDVEGLGVVVAEALAYRRPVVASRAGGIVDLVRHEETGLLVPPGDPAALANAIRRLLDDPDLARRLGQAGLEHVRTAFSWPAIIDRLKQLYTRATAQKTP